MINSKLYYCELKLDRELSWSEVTDIYNEIEGTNHDNVTDVLKRDLRALKDERKQYNIKITIMSAFGNEDGQKPTLVFSDTHFPYHREGYLEFLRVVHKKYNCNDTVICLGDLADHHAISRHDKEADAVGDVTEFEQALAEVKKLIEVFPNGIITLGNHDRIPVRQAATIGLSERYLKSFAELWELPETWQVIEEIAIDDVLYSHGLGGGGKDGAINKAIGEQMSIAQGHYHAFGGCKYIANKRSLIFGLNTGCLCDPNSLAMAYGKHAKYRPTLGCGLVYDNNFAIFVPWVLE